MHWIADFEGQLQNDRVVQRVVGSTAIIAKAVRSILGKRAAVFKGS